MAAVDASIKNAVVKEFQCFLFFSEAELKSCTAHNNRDYIHTVMPRLGTDSLIAKCMHSL